ncbi:MAG: polysaccharide deacetylase family protein [Rhodothermaceae bacterium]|nr:polysaccharide deacetylase family protein [Rhodothermaceae bacterium]MXX58717.1 polysaccharide deacetylase family protein [Rhodothermaceae bacterium]MYD18167.1 polysaccharide deacetylase family protein [Rhodothermaceae bacterium]MYD57084.1 polysaccharide deacetylase family protein [Rhodothermaceae bacterium]MYI42716.1 polysaccharide deacetylase family protein [Rhodothermaceae bacterium]
MSLDFMTRRSFLKSVGVSALAAATKRQKTHVITLSFDDGFRKSSIETARIFEKHGLSACINVIATAHHDDFVPPDEYHSVPAGDFGLWNELVARGHEVMPHGYKHRNLTEVPLQVAKDLIMRCLDYFSEALNGFDAKEAIFNFPYNASNPDIEEWLADQVRAFRTGYAQINALPHAGQKKLICSSHGPGNIDAFLSEEIDRFIASPGGWLIINAHGLDGEGWGPLSASHLDGLLFELKAIEKVLVIPSGRALADV